MKLVRLFLGLALISVGACSLNPQPFPPQDKSDNPTAGLGDDGGSRSSDAGSMMDVATIPPDAESDAGLDAPADAPLDALLDGESDAALSSD